MQSLACIDFTSEISIHIIHCTHIKYIQREINACKRTMLATYSGVHNTTCNTQRFLIAIHTHIHTQIQKNLQLGTIRSWCVHRCIQKHTPPEGHGSRCGNLRRQSHTFLLAVAFVSLISTHRLCLFSTLPCNRLRALTGFQRSFHIHDFI